MACCGSTRCSTQYAPCTQPKVHVYKPCNSIMLTLPCRSCSALHAAQTSQAHSHGQFYKGTAPATATDVQGTVWWLPCCTAHTIACPFYLAKPVTIAECRLAVKVSTCNSLPHPQMLLPWHRSGADSETFQAWRKTHTALPDVCCRLAAAHTTLPHAQLGADLVQLWVRTTQTSGTCGLGYVPVSTTDVNPMLSVVNTICFYNYALAHEVRHCRGCLEHQPGQSGHCFHQHPDGPNTQHTWPTDMY
jgi:hypothetical protein